MRMRTIEEGYAEIKERDPNTSLSKNAWRTLIKTGVIPSVNVGTKKLVNMEIAERYFCNDDDSDTRGNTPSRGSIRRIEV